MPFSFSHYATLCNDSAFVFWLMSKIDFLRGPRSKVSSAEQQYRNGFYWPGRLSKVLTLEHGHSYWSINVWFKKTGYTFATVYSSKCVTVFLNQTLAAVENVMWPYYYVRLSETWPNGWTLRYINYRKVASSRLVYYSILELFGQRSRYISIKFPLYKPFGNLKTCN